jgi:hypothetical protein
MTTKPKAKSKSAKPKVKGKAKPKKATTAKGHLRPGELDGMVLAYMRAHKDELPLTPSAIGKGLGRSSGAVANCLARLAKRKEARQAKRKPRAYALPVSK